MKHKFKVGDRVKIINDLIFNTGLKVGDVGDITNTNEIEITINFHKKGCEDQICDLEHVLTFVEPVDKDLASEDLEDCVEYGLISGEFVKEAPELETLDEQIEYHEKKLAELKTQKEKEKWQFTEDEKVILRNLPEKYKYIARDKDDCIAVYVGLPNKRSYDWNDENDTCRLLELFNDIFQCIQWTDDKPCEFRKYI